MCISKIKGVHLEKHGEIIILVLMTYIKTLLELNQPRQLKILHQCPTLMDAKYPPELGQKQH